MSFERPNIQAMTGYTSGEQPDSGDVIKLNTNENPFPPGPAVVQALKDMRAEDLRRYPPPTAHKLRAAIAARHGLDIENIIVTNGGDELLRLAISTYVDPSESIAIADPSYSLYEVLAQAHGCQVARFDLQDNWSLPDNYAEHLNSCGSKLCFVVNPHAPSGQLTSVEQLHKLATSYSGILLIDEAYADFIDPDLRYNSIPLIQECDNVIILRTFSKGYSLAGLRIAYGLGPASLINPMQYKTKDSYNTDLIAQTLANAAIQDQEYACGTWDYVREQRELLAQQLRELGLDSPASQSNFILVTVPTPYQADSIYQALKSRGILVRFFNAPRLENRLRISIGSADENTKLVSALKDILA